MARIGRYQAGVRSGHAPCRSLGTRAPVSVPSQAAPLPTPDRSHAPGPVRVLTSESQPPDLSIQTAPETPALQGIQIDLAQPELAQPELVRPEPAREIKGYVAGRVAFSAVDGPGKRYVLFLQGCQHDCLTCPRPMMMPPVPHRMVPKTVDEVLADIGANAPFLTGVTVSGGEPTLQPEFLAAVLRGLIANRSTARLTRFVATNGNARSDVWAELAPLVHGVMVDLNALDDEQNVILSGHSNRTVLATIHELASRKLLHEIRLRLVPGVNDSDPDLRRTANWLLGIDPQIRLRVVEFRRRGTRACARDLAEPRRTDFKRYWNVLSGAGIENLIVP